VNLNGLTLEMEACLDTKACTDALYAQEAVTRQNPKTVFWLTHSERMEPQEQCSKVHQWQKHAKWVFEGMKGNVCKHGLTPISYPP